MAVGLRIGLFLLMAVALAGCGTTIETTPATLSAAVKDCREPAGLFNTFTARATSVAWGGSGGAVTLSMALAIDNATDEPATLSNSGSGILYTVGFVLRDDKGKTHAPSVTSGVLAGARVHEVFKPGEAKDGTVSFAAPRGRYTLAIERNLSGQAAPPTLKNAPLVCTVTVIEPARERAKKPAPTARP